MPAPTLAGSSIQGAQVTPLSSRPIKTPWHSALARRIATLWVTKMLGTTLGISGFFVLYFWVMHHPLGLPLTMPLTAVDHWVPLSDDALPLYASLWLYVGLAPALAKDRAELLLHAQAAALMAAIGLAVFWLFPTVVPVFAVDWTQYPSLQFLKSTDAGGNAFPSLHVSFAVFTAVLMTRQLRSVDAPAWVLALNWLWAAGIVYSTLATRQHVLLDVLGGTALAGFMSWITGPARRRLILVGV